MNKILVCLSDAKIGLRLKKNGRQNESFLFYEKFKADLYRNS